MGTPSSTPVHRISSTNPGQTRLGADPGRYSDHDLINFFQRLKILHHYVPTALSDAITGRRRVLIADDHEPTRVLMRTLIRLEGMQVVGEAKDGSEAVALA